MFSIYEWFRKNLRVTILKNLKYKEQTQFEWKRSACRKDVEINDHVIDTSYLWGDNEDLTWRSVSGSENMGRMTVSFFLLSEIWVQRKPVGGSPARFRKWKSGFSPWLWMCRQRDSCHRHLVIFEYRTEPNENMISYSMWTDFRIAPWSKLSAFTKTRQSKTNNTKHLLQNHEDPQLNVFSFIQTATTRTKCIPTFSQRPIKDK